VCRSCLGAVPFESPTGAIGLIASAWGEAVDNRGGDGQVAEDVSPAGKGQVGGHDERRVFVARGVELDEQVRVVLVEGDVADLVDNRKVSVVPIPRLSDVALSGTSAFVHLGPQTPT